jgi:peptidoglycan/xylan/chitin deacetylase (PgdA/CDA1 family)
LTIKRAIVAAATSRWVTPFFRPLIRNQASIFMFHRFEDPERGVGGHSAERLVAGLRDLKRMGFRFVGLEELIDTGREGGDVTGMAAFSVDDGYADFYRVAAPLFLEADCPVTVFLPTGFLNEQDWQWWDRLRHLTENSTVTSVTFELDGEKLEASWDDEKGRVRARRWITERLHPMSHVDRAIPLGQIEEQLQVAVPEELPTEYLPMTWDEVREMGKKGVTFGPHTVSHGNSSFWTEEEFASEVSRSWAHIQDQTEAGIPVFCYPYGGLPGSRSRAAGILADAGMIGAVTAAPDYVSRKSIQRDPYFLDRFSWPESQVDLRQISAGIERAKAFLR